MQLILPFSGKLCTLLNHSIKTIENASLQQSDL